MVGMKVISKPVDGLHSTAIYLLKKDNMPIQTSKRYHVFVKNDKVMYGLLTKSSDRQSDRPSKALSLSLTVNPRAPVVNVRWLE